MIQHITTKKIFYTLSGVLMLLVLTYGYMLNTTILNVVARQKAQTQIALLSSDTSDLETSYIALQNDVSINLAYSLGFKDVSNPQFLYRNNSAIGLSLR
jgi:hypothetical protein